MRSHYYLEKYTLWDQEYLSVSSKRYVIIYPLIYKQKCTKSLGVMSSFRCLSLRNEIPVCIYATKYRGCSSPQIEYDKYSFVQYCDGSVFLFISVFIKLSRNLNPFPLSMAQNRTPHIHTHTRLLQLGQITFELYVWWYGWIQRVCV